MFLKYTIATIQPFSIKLIHKVYDALKALNWRQNKAVTDRLEYSKKMQLYYNDQYGIPWEEYILGAFKERIEALKQFPNVTVTFEEANND